MALDERAPSERPGTHALIIGASIRDIPGIPAQSARHFARWLLDRFNNPSAPLASLAFLARAETEPPPAPAEFGLLTPESFAQGFVNWSLRLASSPGNIGIFYFAGPVMTVGGDRRLMIAHNASDPSAYDTFDFDELKAVARSIPAQRQLLLLDEFTSRGKAFGKGRHLPMRTPVPRTDIFQTVIRAPFDSRARTHSTSRFSADLVDALDQSGVPYPAPVVSAALLARRLLASKSGVTVEDSQDFDLHHPHAAVVPGTIAPPAQPTPAAEGSNSGAAEEETGESTIDSQAQDGPPPREGDRPRPAPAKKAAKAEAGKNRKKSGIGRIAPGKATTGGTPQGPDDGDAGLAETGSAPIGTGEASPPAPQHATEFVADDAETENDKLARGTLAVALARRLHRIWRQANGLAGDGSGAARRGAPDERAAFVVHIDAPWGGGKTTFANLMARALNPQPGGAPAAEFLRRNHGEGVDLGGAFLDHPPQDEQSARALAAMPAGARRPWIVVPFNAWQAEHCAPPWWVFYQAIRKGCFDAIWAESDEPWRPVWPPQPAWRAALRRRALRIRRHVTGKLGWAGLWIGELAWRLSNPKVRSLLITAAVSGALFWFLHDAGFLRLGGSGNVGFNLESAIGLMVAGLTGVTALWGFGALFTESIAPGTSDLGERLNLGSGDPFARFRRHFARTMEAVQRPVLVVVDDLDRCRPEFVVDLVRGIQTLLRSPRLVVAILGDRDWIERAFEAHHQSMSQIDVGPEQSFGARFVEKAIQMSFILPRLDDRSRNAYVRSLLVREPAAAAPSAGGDGREDDGGRSLEERATALAEKFMRMADGFRERAEALEHVRDELGAELDRSDEVVAEQVERAVAGVCAISAAVDEAAAEHQLESLAHRFPANPRQIKRIVNTFTIYHASALANLDMPDDAEFRHQLAIWVILMTEWPRTWRLLAACPALAGIVTADDWQARLDALAKDRPAGLPGSRDSLAWEIERIRSHRELLQLMQGDGASCAGLSAERAADLASLTPLPARRRLPDPPRG